TYFHDFGRWRPLSGGRRGDGRGGRGVRSGGGKLRLRTTLTGPCLPSSGRGRRHPKAESATRGPFSPSPGGGRGWERGQEVRGRRAASCCTLRAPLRGLLIPM